MVSFIFGKCHPCKIRAVRAGHEAKWYYNYFIKKAFADKEIRNVPILPLFKGENRFFYALRGHKNMRLEHFSKIRALILLDIRREGD